MKLTNLQLTSFANAIELLSPSMGQSQRKLIVAESPKTPRVKGNLNYPILAYRVGRARIAIEPHVRALQEFQQTQLAATRVAPPKMDGQPLPPEEQWPSDVRKFEAAMASIKMEEIDLGELKPLTWDILTKAGIVGGTPAEESEIEFDGSFVAALGEFLAGEPPENLP